MINIKKLEKSSIKRITELEVLYLGETLGEEMLNAEIDNPTLCFLGAYNKEEVVGYISCYAVMDEGEVLNFVVDERYQRQGIGQMLFEEFLKLYPDIKKITLEVRENNNKGLSFYRKNGFKNISVRKNYYSNGDNAIVMMKEII